jgi:hypothetical protein
VERDPVGEAQLSGQRLQAGPVRPLPADIEAQPGALVAERVEGVQDQVDALVRHQPAEHDHPVDVLARGQPVELVGSPGAVAEDADRSGPAELGAHLLAGGVRHRHGGPAPVDEGHHDPLERATDPGQRGREVGAELLLVDVVEHQHHRGVAADEQRRERRDAALGVDHDVEPATPPQQPQRRMGIEGERAACAPDLDALADLARALLGFTGGEELDPGTGRVQRLGELPRVPLRAPGQAVPGVAPVDDDGAAAGQSGVFAWGHLRPPPQRWEA